MAENSLQTVAARKPWQFQPGQSGNPGGRPKGLAALVRARTNDGADLVTFYLDVFRGKKRASLNQRMDAANWLAERGFGKPAQPLTGDEDGSPLRFTIAIDRRDDRNDDGNA